MVSLLQGVPYDLMISIVLLGVPNGSLLQGELHITQTVPYYRVFPMIW